MVKPSRKRPGNLDQLAHSVLQIPAPVPPLNPGATTNHALSGGFTFYVQDGFIKALH
jgi:hypothetical protein